MNQAVLVVDDEPDLLTLYELTLLREGHDVDTAASVEEAWARLTERVYALVICDLRLPDGNGLDLLRRLEAGKRRERVVVVTAYGSTENAVEALKAGAFDYLSKPVDLRQFRQLVNTALGQTPTAPQSAPQATSRLPPPVSPRALVGDAPAMAQVRERVDKVARSMAPVLVQGESGTGKELVARAIHAASPRAGQPFVAVNCGAIPENLIEAEFFGYRKGAFTGANEDRMGFFQAAQGGTLFLDEIGDLPLSMQPKLLRVIQERAVRPVGATAEVPTNVRIVSATHRDLATEVAEGRFRQDLYYRLNVIAITVPPLRERLTDLLALAQALLERIAHDAGVADAPMLTGDALARLTRHPFPGNVRELENLLHRAVAMAAGAEIDEADLGLPAHEPDALDEAAAAADAERASASGEPSADLPTDLARHLDEVERALLLQALHAHGFNRTAAGARMGLTLRQMRYRMARLGISDGDAG
ncbi:MAG: sigma-54 dependent transcriptional regulator [Proteobacteria bacterium]|nr:sigma-54 dependent transcriptional regulator [Pseudomonadota bacterium]